MILRSITTIALLLPLTGCIGGATVLMVLEGLASAATVADRVVGIDVSLSQTTPGKTPIGAIIPLPNAAYTSAATRP